MLNLVGDIVIFVYKDNSTFTLRAINRKHFSVSGKLFGGRAITRHRIKTKR